MFFAAFALLFISKLRFPKTRSTSEITQSEVRSALNQMANDKAVGPDQISIEKLKAGGSTIH